MVKLVWFPVTFMSCDAPVQLYSPFYDTWIPIHDLEPEAAYERQQSIDYFDLLLILDFNWSPLSLQLPEKKHSLNQ